MDVLALFVFSCTLLNYSCVDRHVSLDSHWAISMIFVVRIPRWELVTQKKKNRGAWEEGILLFKEQIHQFTHQFSPDCVISIVFLRSIKH